MQLEINVTRDSTYRVEFLTDTYTTYPETQEQFVNSLNGILTVTVPSECYVIPIIRVTDMSLGNPSLVYNTKVECVPSPQPSPTPAVTNSGICNLFVFNPTGTSPLDEWSVSFTDCNGNQQLEVGNGIDDPRKRYAKEGSISTTGLVRVDVYSPLPTPIPIGSTKCVIYTFYPTGTGPLDEWKVYFTDCDGNRQLEVGNGIDDPRKRFAREGSVNTVDFVRVEMSSIPTPIAPTPVTPIAPTPVTPVTPTPVTPITPIAPTPSSGGEENGGFDSLHAFIVNGTGNSVDFGQTNAISPNKVDLFVKMVNAGVDGIRHAMKIGGYNPSEGLYLDNKLSAFINWAKSLRPNGNLLQEIMVVPVLSMGDVRLQDGDYHCDADGHRADCTLALDAVPSYFSQNAISILDEAYHRFFSYVQQNHENDVYLFSLAGGNSEEHYMPYASNYPGGPGCGNNGYGGIGDYSESARNAWFEYQLTKWSGPLPFLIDGVQYVSGQAPMPRIQPDNQNNRFVNLSRRDHREIYRFWNTGVYKAWERFVDIGRQYLPNALYESFVADMYNQQGIQWTINAGAMHKLMQKADVWYHTEHFSPYEWAKCLVAIDIFEGGTYGTGKISATEFDSHDAGNPTGGSFDEDLMVRKIEKMIDHGLRITHFALNWSDSQINALGRVMSRVRTSRNNNSGYIRPSLLQRPSAQVYAVNTANMFTDGDYLYRPWEQAGNSRSNPFDAKIVNIRVEDGFFNNE